MWSDQLRNSQKVHIKQYCQLDQIQACSSFLSSFTCSVCSIWQWFAVCEWLFYAVMGIMEKREYYQEWNEMSIQTVVLATFKVRVCRRCSKMKNCLLVTNLHYSLHLFLLCKNLEICQWVRNFNKQSPEDVATHYLRTPNPCKYEYAEVSRPGNALFFLISLMLIPLLTKIVLKAS